MNHSTLLNQALLAQLAIVVLISFVTSCSPIKTRVIYNEDTTFASYKNYGIVPNDQPDLVNLPMKKQLLDDLITTTIHHQLQNNGFTAANENPDFLVAYYIVTNAKTDVYYLDNYYMGFGYAPNRSSTRDSNRLVETTYEQGILVIDIIDNASKERIWTGRSETRTGVYSEPKKIEQRTVKAVEKVIAQFPPS